MKWKSQDNKEELDLDKIAYWKYTSKADSIEKNRQREELIEKDPGVWCWRSIVDEISTLKVYMGGDGPLLFKGEDADEIYKMLISRQEVI